MDGDAGLKALKALLRAHRITQAEVGDALGLSHSSISLKLAGKRAITPDEFRAVERYAARRLRTRPSHLLLYGRVA